MLCQWGKTNLIFILCPSIQRIGSTKHIEQSRCVYFIYYTCGPMTDEWYFKKTHLRAIDNILQIGKCV